MNIVQLFTQVFWATAEQAAVLIMPIIAIILIMKIIYSVIIRGSD